MKWFWLLLLSGCYTPAYADAYLSWDAVPGAAWYEVYRACDVDDPTFFRDVASVQETSWVDDTEWKYGNCSWYVTTIDTAYNESAPSNIITKSLPVVPVMIESDWSRK